MPRQDIGSSVRIYYPDEGSTSSIGMFLHAPRHSSRYTTGTYRKAWEGRTRGVIPRSRLCAGHKYTVGLADRCCLGLHVNLVPGIMNVPRLSLVS
jgi:hypothetical protein